ncbi:dihydropteridine reductase, partial [Staphylococcus equorum]
IVGSDEFVTQNIEKLLELDVKTSQIVIDKREKQRSEFLTI